MADLAQEEHAELQEPKPAAGDASDAHSPHREMASHRPFFFASSPAQKDGTSIARTY